ncbi:MAG: hypothetical protein J6A84_04770 [Clostridia bacterium]|nr:hypothetical protein [Clostridia bacterium]
MTNRNKNIMIVALLLLAAMAVILGVFLWQAKQNFPENIKVREDGVTEGILAVRDLRLHPAESREYSVDLFCEASGSYYISLDYEEKKNGGMKSFVDVTVKFGDSVVYEGNLATLMDADIQLQFLGELHATDPTTISICYEMPIEVGNEAQRTYADFDVHFEIKKA